MIVQSATISPGIIIQAAQKRWSAQVIPAAHPPASRDSLPVATASVYPHHFPVHPTCTTFDILAYIFRIIRNCKNMQLKFQDRNQLPPTPPLAKSHSANSPTRTAHSTSSSTHSIDSFDDQYRTLAIRWILSNGKKLARDTHYLAISLLNRLTLTLTQENYEKTAVTVLLLAAKMNEIYPPSISALSSSCSKTLPSSEIISFQGSVLSALDFDLTSGTHVYAHIHNILGWLYQDKLDDCEKLLRMVATHPQIYLDGDEILAYAVIYLIIPDFVRKMHLRDNQKIKTLAVKIYGIYNEARLIHERQKENRFC